MSKQSNQKYRKEKEGEHLKKAGIDQTSSATAHHVSKQAKLNNELNSPAERTER
ncbi:MAG TPA: hypothetical protein VN258_20015 [Mobilitalea sp.]|nr:hypothetical protein [Mobilitalea sp.]